MILDGEVESTFMDIAEYKKSLASKSDILKSMTESEKRQEIFALKTVKTVQGGSVQSGDSFGDKEFRTNGLRTSTCKFKFHINHY